MTRETAIEWLDDIKNITENWSQEVAIDMAIEALKAPTESTNTPTDTPTNAPTDLISRQAVKAKAHLFFGHSVVFESQIDAIPSAETHDKRTETHGVCSDLISRQDAINIVDDVEDKWMRGEIDLKYAPIIKGIQSLPSAEPLVLTCDGCRHVGTYDTDFPCSGCIRREKDYYEQER